MTGEVLKTEQDQPADRRQSMTIGSPKAGFDARKSRLHPQPQDIEGLVREALSQHLMRSPYLPPSLARTLATDVAAMPAPCGANGTRGSTPVKTDASPEATDATLSGLRSQIKTASIALRELLIHRHDLPTALVDELIMHGQERALTKVMASGFPREQIEALAAELSSENSITPTLLLRSLCLGQLMFFELAMAALAATSVDRVHALIFDDGPRGFSQLYELAALPLGLFRAFRGTIEVVSQLGLETTRHWRSDFTDEIIARLVKEDEQICPEDLEYVLSQLSHRPTEASPAAEMNFLASA